MRRFKLFVVAIFLVAVSSAFAVQKQKTNAATTYGYSAQYFEFPEPHEYCLYGEIDFSWTCDRFAFGQVCTVNGVIAYQSWEECEGLISRFPLYRLY